MITPLFPQVRVILLGQDNNAFSVLGLCQRAAKKAGLSKDEIAGFMKEASSGDYEHLLQTCIKYFNVE